ncbi:MAG: hypothetical protein ABIO02_01440 [Patescibacteria group bacterium]
MRNPKIILISFLLLVLLVLIIIANKLTKKNEISSGNPTPPLISITSYVTQPPNPNVPGEIMPTFTGARDVTFAQPTQQYIDKRGELRESVPLNGPTFSIDFNFREDKFTVTLKEPKNESQAAFNEWLKNNYPELPLEDFIVR